MDISSGIVAFGVTCPGSLMEDLQKNDTENVRNIKSLQMSFSKTLVTWQCHASCKDLNIVTKFIESISALEELSILNYETDTSTLWPAIFFHAKSLNSLAIHTPPQKRPNVWNASTVEEVADRITQLKKLEIDLGLEEGEHFIEDEFQYGGPVFEDEPSTLEGKDLDAAQHEISTGISLFSSKMSQPTKTLVLDQLLKMDRLESLLINVNLTDEASVFADRHSWGVMGSISFPPLNKEICQALAHRIFKGFHAKNPDCALNHLEVRFPRRCWDDRAQFWTVAGSVHIVKEGNDTTVQCDNWKEYLPDWPRDGILRHLSDEGFAQRSS